MGKKLLKESAASKLTVAGNRWKATLAVAGQGSSGFYSEDVLREFGPQALAPGSHAYAGHPTEQNPGRSIKDLVGTYPDGAVYEEGVGLVGELEVLPHWKDFVEAVAPHSALSIYMLGESDTDGNVTSLIADRQNSVDLVSYAGLEGSQLTNKLYESAIAHSDETPVDASAENKEEGNMEKVLEAIVALSTKIDAFVTESRALATANVKAEADADAAEVAAKAAVEATLLLKLLSPVQNCSRRRLSRCVRLLCAAKMLPRSLRLQRKSLASSRRFLKLLLAKAA